VPYVLDLLRRCDGPSSPARLYPLLNVRIWQRNLLLTCFNITCKTHLCSRFRCWWQVPYVLDLLRKCDGPSSPAWLYSHPNPGQDTFLSDLATKITTQSRLISIVNAFVLEISLTGSERKTGLRCRTC